jgi:transposase
MKNNPVKHVKTEQFNCMNSDAAGIDIGGSFHYVAVPADRDHQPVRKFDNFTADLHALADWLTACHIKTVAMESTGVYWIPVYELLERRGFEVLLVNARHIKNVPGRKTDVKDCQWIQQLHSYGLLSASFRPTQEICQLRAYTRQRETLTRYASYHIAHMQKALEQMNVQLVNVISDITGVTGMTIIRAILAGERSPEKLAIYRDWRCKQSLEVIKKSLEGNYLEEHIFALQQAVDLFDTYQKKIVECDGAIESVLNRLAPREKTLEETLPAKQKKRRSNELHFDATHYLKQLTGGIDLTQIDGISAHSALKIIAEIGTDMSKWPTSKHFGSWLGLAPSAKISGGKVLSSRTKPSTNRAAALLRISASALSRSYSGLGAFFRRQKARLGAPKAITATAYKIARLIYVMLKYKRTYVDIGSEGYEQQHRDRAIKQVQKRARQLGFQLTPTCQTGQVP